MTIFLLTLDICAILRKKLSKCRLTQIGKSKSNSIYPFFFFFFFLPILSFHDFSTTVFISFGTPSCPAYLESGLCDLCGLGHAGDEWGAHVDSFLQTDDGGGGRLLLLLLLDRLLQALHLLLLLQLVRLRQGGKTQEPAQNMALVRQRERERSTYYNRGQGTYSNCVFKFPVFSLSDCKFSLCQFM